MDRGMAGQNEKIMEPIEDRKHASREPDPRLPEICDNIARLLGEVPRVRDLLDLAAGAAASLLRAEQLGYQDRTGRLPDEYYEALRNRSRFPLVRWCSTYDRFLARLPQTAPIENEG